MKRLIIIYTLVIGTLFTGCDDYLDVNTDPNNPTVVPANLILPVAQVYTASWLAGNRRMNHLGNMFMYNWSESAGYSWYNDEFQYRANATTFYSALFDQAYTIALKQYAELDKLDDTYLAYKAMGTIMKSYTFQLLVDLYGDIPYSEALQRSGNNTPKYDGAQGIYDDLIVKLTEAIDQLNTAGSLATYIIPEDDDAMFGGDLDAWKQFANSLKLRILTRERAAKGDAYVTAELAVITAEGSGFMTSNVVINPGYLNETNKQSPFFAAFGEDVTGTEVNNGKATCATDYIITYMQNTNDTRIDYLYEEPGTGHLGVQQGITSSNATQSPELVSNIGPGLLMSSSQDVIIMTAAEIYFNQAELALAGLGGDPEALYNSGIAASFSTLGADGAAAYSVQNVNNVSYAASADKLEAIITQKWLAVNGITAEQSWFDLSRTGFPANLPISVEVANLERPFRLSYPASELSTNAANVPSQPDVFTTKIFWGN
ncbi:MAG: hypothetical protein ACI83W_000274 [Marinoscillum sp.]|jgi:hypothetical protein